MYRKYILLMMAGLTPASVLAQDDGFAMKPSGDPEAQVDFRNVALAKFLPDSNAIRITIPSYESRDLTRTVNVVKLVQEQRVREVLVDGEKVKQAYMVQVPVREQRTIKSKANMFKGLKQREVPLRSVRAWTLDGTVLSAEQLAERLETTQHVFARQTAPGRFKPVDPFFRSVLAADALILFLPPQVDLPGNDR